MTGHTGRGVVTIGSLLVVLGAALRAGPGWMSGGPQGAGPISALATDPGSALTVYAGSIGQGLFKSVDEGVSWASSNSGLSNPDIRRGRLLWTRRVAASTPERTAGSSK